MVLKYLKNRSNGRSSLIPFKRNPNKSYTFKVCNLDVPCNFDYAYRKYNSKSALDKFAT